MPVRFAVLLFERFETLDAFGPAEIFGALPEKFAVEFYSIRGGIVRSSQNVRVETLSVEKLKPADPKAENPDDEYLLLVPGGMGTRTLVNDEDFLGVLAWLAEKARFVLTVCTGSALLAGTGLLKGRKATSNKAAFGWATSVDRETNWLKRARWARDEKFYTSSGVSAGMDMALGFLADTEGRDVAETIARRIEYLWNDDPDDDPFAVE